MEISNIQVPPETIADPNDYYPYDNEPAREESGDTLNSASAPVQVKKRLIFRDEEDEGDINDAEVEAGTETAEPEQAEEQLNAHLDKVLPGLEAPEAVTAREGGEADQDAAEQNAPNSANGEEPLTLSPEEQALTDSALALLNINRKSRYQLGEIFARMYELLAKRGSGSWQAWCRRINFPVKTADSYRKAYGALKLVPEELLMAVLEHGVDPAKPKATKVLLEIVDTCYEGECTDKLVTELVAAVKEATKREANKPAAPASIVAPVPTAPLVSVHGSGNGDSANGEASGIESNTVSGASPAPAGTNGQGSPAPEPKPEPVQTVKLLLKESEHKQFEALELNLRSFLNTSTKEETVMEALRQFAALCAKTDLTAPADEEVLVCV